MEQLGQLTTSWQEEQDTKVWYPRRLRSTMDCLPAWKFSTKARARVGPMARPLPGTSSRFMSTSSTWGIWAWPKRSSSLWKWNFPSWAMRKDSMEGVAEDSRQKAPVFPQRNRATSLASYRGLDSDL